MSKIYQVISGRLFHFNTIFPQFYDQISAKVENTIGSVIPMIDSPKEHLLIALVNHVGIDSINLMFDPNMSNSFIKYTKRMKADNLMQIYKAVVWYYIYFFIINNDKIKYKIDKHLLVKQFYDLMELDIEDFNKFCIYMNSWEPIERPTSLLDPIASIFEAMGTDWNEDKAIYLFGAITTAIKRTRDIDESFSSFVNILEYRN